MTTTSTATTTVHTFDRCVVVKVHKCKQFRIPPELQNEIKSFDFFTMLTKCNPFCVNRVWRNQIRLKLVETFSKQTLQLIFPRFSEVKIIQFFITVNSEITLKKRTSLK
jgi:hypothetical protein